MNNFLQNNTVIKSHRQPKNLKQLLTKAKFEDKPNNPHPKVFKCGRSNCGIYESIIERESFQFKNGSIFHVKSNMDCSSKNLLYVITCQGCWENYIGQTGNEMRKRMTVHRQQIRDPNTRIRSGTPIPESDQGLQYQNQIRDPNTRIRSGTQYQNQIRDPNTRMIPLSGHLSSCTKNKDKPFILFPLYKFSDNANEQQRVTQEAEFITKYKPKLNR